VMERKMMAEIKRHAEEFAGYSGYPAGSHTVGAGNRRRASQQLPLIAPRVREMERTGMVHIAGEIVIHRPVDEVFDFVADERNEPRYNPRMVRAEQISPGPIGVGTRFEAETRTMGRSVAMTIEVTAYERPRRLANSTHLANMEIQGTLTFDPVPEGTRMRWSWELEPRGPLKLVTPLIARIGRRQEITIWTSLKHFLEGEKSPTPQR
jgi:hypothetical protein